MKHPLTLEPNPEAPGAFLVKDAANVYVGAIHPDGADWRNFHPVEQYEPEAQGGPFQTIAAAFAAFQATP
jgi:hypothetical protein